MPYGVSEEVWDHFPEDEQQEAQRRYEEAERLRYGDLLPDAERDERQAQAQAQAQRQRQRQRERMRERMRNRMRNRGGDDDDDDDGGGGDGLNFGYFTEPFTDRFEIPPGAALNLPTLPQFDAPAYEQYPEFAYEDFISPDRFTAPTGETALQEPGYQFRLDEGRKALERAASAKGVLRSGKTMLDVLTYGQNYASNEYQNVYDRSLGEYDRRYGELIGEHQLGFQEELSSWTQNAAEHRGAYDRRFTEAEAEYQPEIIRYQTEAAAEQRRAERSFDEAMRTFMANYGIFEQNRQRAADFLFRGAELGVSAE